MAVTTDLESLSKGPKPERINTDYWPENIHVCSEHFNLLNLFWPEVALSPQISFRLVFDPLSFFVGKGSRHVARCLSSPAAPGSENTGGSMPRPWSPPTRRPCPFPYKAAAPSGRHLGGSEVFIVAGGGQPLSSLFLWSPIKCVIVQTLLIAARNIAGPLSVPFLWRIATETHWPAFVLFQKCCFPLCFVLSNMSNIFLSMLNELGQDRGVDHRLPKAIVYFCEALTSWFMIFFLLSSFVFEGYLSQRLLKHYKSTWAAQ